MHHHILREVAKVGVGLVMADIICSVWLSSAGLLPITVLGIAWSVSAVWPGIVFDLALILLLAHYGWNMKLPITSPTEGGLLKLIGIVFLIVALLHLVRIAFGWNFILNEVNVPIWLSWLGVFIPGYLSYSSFHFALKK
ncbi:hypothetical protein KGQ25_03010 [Patescibacteria group bacterium]|nr:hypothetical protein [Patescibacteria group bacterium]MDE2173292.1 hypothetical protein [Patescibacteria group bacterium]